MQIKTKIVSGNRADSKPVEQEVNGTVILPRLVFPGLIFASDPLESNNRAVHHQRPMILNILLL